MKAGFGSTTVKQINEEVHKKFPNKTTAKLRANIPDKGIISYSYFNINIKFTHKFNESTVKFKGAKVPGFKANNLVQRKQISVYRYKSKSDFVVRLQAFTKIS